MLEHIKLRQIWHWNLGSLQYVLFTRRAFIWARSCTEWETSESQTNPRKLKSTDTFGELTQLWCSSRSSLPIVLWIFNGVSRRWEECASLQRRTTRGSLPPTSHHQPLSFQQTATNPDRACYTWQQRKRVPTSNMKPIATMSRRSSHKRQDRSTTSKKDTAQQSSAPFEHKIQKLESLESSCHCKSHHM